ncbi:MAG: ATP-binding protein [Anaerolineaceae bacterium]
MSLRQRLTFLYTSLLGGVLILFAVLVYGLVSIFLIDQIDHNLVETSNELVSSLHLNTSDQYVLDSLQQFSAENFLFQVWGADQTLQVARPLTWETPLDSASQRAGRLVIESTTTQSQHLRVLSVPLQSARGPSGVLQVALSLSAVDITQRTLVIVLIVLDLLALLLTAFITWWLTGKSLEPLAIMTRVAGQITNADDLSRRIPPVAIQNNEISGAINSFNATLDRLEKLFTSQRRFLADVSHDLRTPLTVIKGNVSLIRKMRKNDEESLEGIEQEVDRMTRLVGDLLLLAQAESGSLPLDMQNVELDTVLLEVFNQMKILAGGKVDLTISEIDQVQLTGDRDRLKQMLLNLMGNAVQYTPEGGSVTMALSKTELQAKLIISDTGPGIPAEDLPHLFERFYRGQRSHRPDQTSGYGLGLSIAYWIVRNHGGYIEVSSREGQGTTFCVWLPLSKKPEV